MARRPKNPLDAVADAFSRRYAVISKDLADYIHSLMAAGDSPEKAVAAALKKFRIPQRIAAEVGRGLTEAATIGYGVKEVAAPLVIRKTMLSKIWPGDDLKLSQRLHGRGMQAEIVGTIRAEMLKQRGYYAAASDMVDRLGTAGDIPQVFSSLSRRASVAMPGDPAIMAEIARARNQIAKLAANEAPTTALKAAYSALLDKIEKAGQAQIEKAMYYAVQEKARYNVMRIFRTEITKAASLAHDYRAIQNDRVVGVRYKLSTRHPKFDICDFHTGADLYGMGPGVYPKDRHPPHPFHPHCMCVAYEVFGSELRGVSPEFDAEAGAQYLDNLDDGEKREIFGVERSREFADDPEKWREVLPNYQGQRKITAADFRGLKPEYFDR